MTSTLPPGRWPAAQAILTARLRLEPLRAAHATELASLLDDARLHEFTGGRPLPADELRVRYARLESGRSPDGNQAWLNWVVRARAGGEAVGTVQATIESGSASLAWVIGSRYQGRGYAKEAAAGMAEWLVTEGVGALVAWIHPGHAASIAVARHLGMEASDVESGGETRWARAPWG